jgi:hypothetical protein
MHMDTDLTPGRDAAKPPSTAPADHGAMPPSSAERPSFGQSGVWVAGIFLLGVLGADPQVRGAAGVGSVFAGGAGMLAVGFGAASVVLGWRPSTRRMIPAGAFAVALLAFAAPRTAGPAARLASFAERAPRQQPAEQTTPIDQLAEDGKARERVAADWLREFSRMFAAEFDAPPQAPAPPAPVVTNALRKS